MSNTKKFAVNTQIDVFTLSGEDYFGYYNVVDGVAYTSKYSQNTPLENTGTVKNVLLRSDKFLNRLPLQDFTLTYILSDFEFHSNEFINANALDNKLNKSFANFLDSYRACFMASSNLPFLFTGVAKTANTVDGWRFVWFNSTDTVPILSLENYNHRIKRESKILYIKNTDTPNSTLVVANSGSIFTFKLNRSLATFTQVFSSEYVQTDAGQNGQLKFSKITAVSDFNTTLFVCDSGARTLHQYDIKSVLAEDRALGYKFNLRRSHTVDRGITPALVSAAKNVIAVYDDSNYTVQFYDYNFNLLTSYKNKTLFSFSRPVHIEFNELFNQFFVLTRDLKLVVFSIGNNLPEYTEMFQMNTNILLRDERPIKIQFANSNSDVLYLLTNKTIYKKFLSSVYDIIGAYSFTQGITGTNPWTDNDVMYDFSCQKSSLTADSIIAFGYDQFISYYEVTVFNSLLK